MPVGRSRLRAPCLGLVEGKEAPAVHIILVSPAPRISCTFSCATSRPWRGQREDLGWHSSSSLVALDSTFTFLRCPGLHLPGPPGPTRAPWVACKQPNSLLQFWRPRVRTRADLTLGEGPTSWLAEEPSGPVPTWKGKGEGLSGSPIRALVALKAPPLVSPPQLGFPLWSSGTDM